MASCWDAAAAARTGELARTERAWDARLAHERRTWLVAEGEHGIEGYVAWTVTKADPFVETLMVVDELASISDRARQSLWAAVATQGAQVATVQADFPEDDPIVYALSDAQPSASAQAQVEHPLGVLAGGPMLRIADPATALRARGWGASGALVLEVGETRLEFRSCEGCGTVRETRAEPDLKLSARTLAAIAFGGLRVASAQRLGWIVTREASAVAAADEIFALPPYFSFERF
jgi:predicted acetyltransferase